MLGVYLHLPEVLFDWLVAQRLEMIFLPLFMKLSPVPMYVCYKLYKDHIPA
jgi:hypothetical protein